MMLLALFQDGSDELVQVSLNIPSWVGANVGDAALCMCLVLGPSATCDDNFRNSSSSDLSASSEDLVWSSFT